MAIKYRSPVKVVHIIDSLDVGGAERALSLLVRHMDQARFRCRVFALRGLGPLADDLGSAGMLANNSVGGNLISQLNSLRHYLQSEKPAIVHTHLNYSDLFGGMLARVMGVPVVLSYKASILRIHEGRQAIHNLLTRIASRWSDAIVVLSKALKAYLIQNGIVRADKIKVVYYGIDLAEVDGAELKRKDLGLHEGPVILMVARLEPRKDHATFLRAALLLKEQFPEAQFVLVGDGDPAYRSQIQNAAVPLGGSVKLLGERRDVGQLMRLSDLIVLSSRTEGLGLVLLEAMARSRPVVATRVGGISEIVVDGETGFLVPPGDPQNLAAAMAEVLKHPMRGRELAEAGRRRVEQYFTVQRMAREMERVYEEALVDRCNE